MTEYEQPVLSVPENWEYQEKPERIIWKPIRVITEGGPYLLLVDDIAESSSKIEYFFDKDGKPLFRREKILDNPVRIDINTDIPMQLTVEEVFEDEDEIYRSCAVSFGFPSMAVYKESLLEINYETDLGINFWLTSFCAGFPEEDCPCIVFEGNLDEQGHLTNFFNRELEDVYKDGGWSIDKVGLDGLGIYNSRQFGDERFYIRASLQNNLITLEQELVDPRYEARGVVKIVRSILSPNLEQVAKLAQAATLFDPNKNQILKASWRDAQVFLCNPLLSYRGPLLKLMEEIRQKN